MKCELCGTEFEAKRADARYCSSGCRKKASRTVTDKTVTDKAPRTVTDKKRITQPPAKIYEGYYKSQQYKNLIEELEVKSIKQLDWIPNWKLHGFKKMPTADEVIGLAGGMDTRWFK